MAEEREPGGLKLDELQFGTLNNLGDVSMAGSVSRVRGNSKTFVDHSLRNAFKRDTMQGVNHFYGIVITSRQTIDPTYAKKDHLLVDMGAEEVKVEGYFIYKVFIPEIECRPYPKSMDDPVLYTYPDVYPSKKIEKLGALPPGTVVKVQYTSIATLSDPIIVEAEGDVYFAFEGIDESKLKKLWKSQPKFIIGGLTPNGDRLREALDEMGIPHARAALTEGGDLREEFVDTLIELLDSPEGERIRDRIAVVGTGNDTWHQQNSPTSQHTKGNAIDITIRRPGGAKVTVGSAAQYQVDANGAERLVSSGKEAWERAKEKSLPDEERPFSNPDDPSHASVLDVAAVFESWSSGEFSFIDEYNHPSPKATGPHYHISGGRV